MKHAEDISKYFRESTLSTDPDRHEAIFEKIQRVQDQSKTTTPVLSGFNLRSKIMKSPIVKLAVAAVVIALVVMGLFEFIGNGSGSGIVWAKVAEQVQASPGFTCRSNVTLTNITSGNSNRIDMRMYCSLKYGIRVDQYEDGKVVISNYGNRADNTIVSITHSSKTYTRRPLLKQDITNLEEMSPTKLIQKYLSTNYKELGTEILDGLEVEGIEVNDPSVINTTFPIESIVARLWVSKETGFPIRMEAKMTGNNGALKMEAVMNELQWNIEFSASDFTPDIPPDYAFIDTP